MASSETFCPFGLNILFSAPHKIQNDISCVFTTSFDLPQGTVEAPLHKNIFIKSNIYWTLTSASFLSYIQQLAHGTHHSVSKEKWHAEHQQCYMTSWPRKCTLLADDGFFNIPSPPPPLPSFLKWFIYPFECLEDFTLSLLVFFCSLFEEYFVFLNVCLPYPGVWFSRMFHLTPPYPKPHLLSRILRFTW